MWLARDQTLNVDVAVKEVLVTPGATPEETVERIERAAREARSAARLRDHPNVVTVHDVVVERGTPWTVMQYVPGRSLAEQIAADGPIPRPQVKQIASALLSALAACHAAGITHRDVKPANIMMADDGRILLTDFGIAKSAETSAMTAEDMVIGSLEYIAPERAQGEPATPASDLFSLGVTLYHAVEGVSPFHRGSGVATLSAVLLEPLPAPGNAGRKLAAVIEGLTVKDPDHRLTGPEAAQLLHGAATAGRPARTKTLTAEVSAPGKEPEPATAGPDPSQRHEPDGTAPEPEALRDRLLCLGTAAALLAAGLLIPTGVGVKQTYSNAAAYLAGKTTQATSSHTSYVSLYTSFTSLGDQNYRSWATALCIVLPAAALIIGLLMTLRQVKDGVAALVSLMNLPAVIFATFWVWLPVQTKHAGSFIRATDAAGTYPSPTPGLGLFVYTIPLAAYLILLYYAIAAKRGT
ncbi:hypothetical protein GCM10009838_27870 [Catenulispora subtropica]|uniref:non-specific serine/threonine protein kinase n=1 Tax=Catenulispora subtropica TaxID=450798 RepID=A0ABN2RF20_9ACTN